MWTRQKPLLTIGVSTYNRARQLDVLLQNICPQIENNQDVVEFIICDNASGDQTARVCREAQTRYPFIRYCANSANVGFFENIRHIVHDLSQGEYSWFIGDDEFVIPEGIPRLVEIIAGNPKIEYFYLNHGWISDEEREHLVCRKRSGYPRGKLQLRITTDRIVERWEDLLLLPGKNAIGRFNGVFCQILKTNAWSDQLRHLGNCRHSNQDEYETCLDCVFPFAKIAARHAMGRPAYVIHSPIVFQGMGIQDYFKYSPIHQTLGHHKLLQFFVSMGVGSKIIKKVEREHFRFCAFHYLNYCSHDYSKRMERIYRQYLRAISENPLFWNALKRAVRGDTKDRENVAHHYRCNLLLQMVKHAIRGGKGLVVWGYGQLGHVVIADLGRLARQIKAVVDIDSSLNGQLVPKTKIPIVPPLALADMGNVDVILIASAFYARDIIRTIRYELKLDATIISVHGVLESRHQKEKPKRRGVSLAQ